MSCASSCIRWLLFLFNFLFALGGLAILIVAVLFRTEYDYLIQELSKEIPINAPNNVLIAVGAIIFIIAFFGCCGAIRESHCMVITFAVLLLTILVVQVAAIIYVVVKYKDQSFETTINQKFKGLVEHYGQGTKANDDVVNTLQAAAKCCGYTGVADYTGSIPYSCCENMSEKDTCSRAQAQNTPGCHDKIYNVIAKYRDALAGLVFGIGAVELLGVIFSFCLANSIRNNDRRGYKV